MRYRSRTDIVAQILEAAGANDNTDEYRITKTKIMYKAFLSYTQLKEYISILVESGLLEHRQHNQTYKTTQKGMQFIQTYNQIGKYVVTKPQGTSSTSSSTKV